MNAILPIAAAALLLALAPGCRTTVNSVENADKSAAMNAIRDARIVTDHGLADTVVVTRLNTAVTPLGIMRLQTELENLSNSIRSVNLLVEWYDANAMRIDTAGGGWQQLQLMGRESRSLVFAAPSPQAKDFRLKLLEPQD